MISRKTAVLLPFTRPLFYTSRKAPLPENSLGGTKRHFYLMVRQNFCSSDFAVEKQHKKPFLYQRDVFPRAKRKIFGNHKKEIYGGYVTNYASEVSDAQNSVNWRIFHADETNIYLITKSILCLKMSD